MVPFSVADINLEDIKLSEISQTSQYWRYHYDDYKSLAKTEVVGLDMCIYLFVVCSLFLCKLNLVGFC